MTTRKRFVAYHAAGMLAFCGTLLAVAPALAPLAVGFSAVYVGLMIAAHLVGWMAGGRLRFFGFPVMVLVCFATFGIMGGPSAAMVATALAFYSYWPRRYG